MKQIFDVKSVLLCTSGTFLNIPRGICIIIDNNYKPLIIFEQVDGYLNIPTKTDEVIKLANQ